MSLSTNDVPEGSVQNGAISKRQQKKFQQMLKRIQQSENFQSKSHKRRKQNHDKKSDPQARKLIKTQSQILQGKNKQSSSSVRQQSQQDSKIQQNTVKRTIKDLNDVYNKKYGVPQQTQSFSEYMVNYTYGEKSKYFQKEDQDWNSLQKMEGLNIQPIQSQKDQQITSELNKKLLISKQNCQKLFSKSSKQTIKKLLNQLFAFQLAKLE